MVALHQPALHRPSLFSTHHHFLEVEASVDEAVEEATGLLREDEDESRMTTATIATSAVALRKAAGHVNATSASVLTDTQKLVTHAMKGIEGKIVNSFVPKWKRERLRNPLRKSKMFHPLL